jgi:hypothetical protein
MNRFDRRAAKLVPPADKFVYDTAEGLIVHPPEDEGDANGPGGAESDHCQNETAASADADDPNA